MGYRRSLIDFRVGWWTEVVAAEQRARGRSGERCWYVEEVGVEATLDRMDVQRGRGGDGGGEGGGRRAAGEVVGGEEGQVDSTEGDA